MLHIKFDFDWPNVLSMTPPRRRLYGPQGHVKRTIVSLWELMTPGVGPLLTPRVMVGRIYKEDHYTLIHTKFESSGPCGFGEEDLFMFFP